jgi:hypothetical protein
MRPLTSLLTTSLVLLLTGSVHASPEKSQAPTISYARETLTKRLVAKGFVCSRPSSVTADDEAGTKLDFTACNLAGLKAVQNCNNITVKVMMFNLGPRLLKIDAAGCTNLHTLNGLVEPAIGEFRSYLAPDQ